MTTSKGVPVFERISADPAKMGGVACIRDLRVPVSTIVGLVADGMSFSEILAAYPYLELEDIKESLRYAAYLAKERDIPLTAIK